MKKGQILEGTVEKVLFPNKGLVTVEDRDIIVKNTIPGQKISFMVNKIRKGKAEARLLEILQKSESELEMPVCIHFGECGGCSYQNLSYKEQLTLKETQMKELFTPVLARDQTSWNDVYEGIKESPRQFEYRNKMEFSFGDTSKNGPLALGMHKRGSFYDIVNVNKCQIVDKDFRIILSCCKEFFARREVPFYHRMQHEGYLRHLLVRKAAKTGEILVVLITSSQIPHHIREEVLLEDLTARLTQLSYQGKLQGILHTVNDSLADVVKNDETHILYGQDHFVEQVLGLEFQISPFSFFQTNSLGAEVLYEAARDYIGDAGNVVFDLYSGTGTIAQMLAPVARKVIGVEIVPEAVEAAIENAKRNNLNNCEFIVGDVLKVLDTIEVKPDYIVLDPPRDGIHPKALTKIIEYGVEKMVYISCKPTSLARDLEVFQQSGYRVEKMKLVDMFPGTVHVETVCCLQRVNM
ncbi:MAG: 23S rRNA (uracil(1939)-C(5))-methyltransferase RlmD [Lachnospiraceae bacterium]